MELLSVMPRGSGTLGFYEHAEQRTPLKSLKVAEDVPAAQRTELEVLRTDTPTFLAYAEARRSRHEEWFKVPAARLDVCNLAVPVRPRTNGGAAK
jgi:peptidylprolyl isomerase